MWRGDPRSESLVLACSVRRPHGGQPKPDRGRADDWTALPVLLVGDVEALEDRRHVRVEVDSEFREDTLKVVGVSVKPVLACAVPLSFVVGEPVVNRRERPHSNVGDPQYGSAELGAVFQVGRNRNRTRPWQLRLAQRSRLRYGRHEPLSGIHVVGG